MAARSPQTAKSSQTEPCGVLPLGSAGLCLESRATGAGFCTAGSGGTPWGGRIMES